jgi:hypothetical protein
VFLGDVVKAGDEAVNAWRKLDELGSRFRALRAAWDALFTLKFRGETADTAGQFAVIRNIGADGVWPTYHRGGTPPWPRTMPAYLAWLVSSEAQVWMPPPEEMDSAIEAQRKLVAERQRAARQRMVSTSFTSA